VPLIRVNYEEYQRDRDQNSRQHPNQENSIPLRSVPVRVQTPHGSLLLVDVVESHGYHFDRSCTPGNTVSTRGYQIRSPTLNPWP
jgi:hypothetical protein